MASSCASERPPTSAIIVQRISSEQASAAVAVQLGKRHYLADKLPERRRHPCPHGRWKERLRPGIEHWVEQNRGVEDIAVTRKVAFEPLRTSKRQKDKKSATAHVQVIYSPAS
jgi:hypothetical protein